MKTYRYILLVALTLLITILGCEQQTSDDPANNKLLQITSIRVGTTPLSSSSLTEKVPIDRGIVLSFSYALDTSSVKTNIRILDPDSSQVPFTTYYLDNQHSVSVQPKHPLAYNTIYTLEINDQLLGSQGESFSGASFRFQTQKGTLKINSITLNEKNLQTTDRITNIDFQTKFKIQFNQPLIKENVADQVALTRPGGSTPISLSYQDHDSTLVIENQEALDYYRPYTLTLKQGLAAGEFLFEGFEKKFYTRLDSTNKFPTLGEQELLTRIQQQTFKYFWDLGHPESGMARERNTSGNTVTTGGTGFGIMSIIVGIERDFISRNQGLERIQKILNFLENDATRYHGAWAHWINGSNGQTIPFSEKDNGGDLVETAFLAQGLLTFREYLDGSIEEEQDLINQINRMWEEIEWDWYTQGEDVLYWHWSPEYDFEMNMPIRGHNETQIVYVLAASSPTHSIDATTYHNGYARNGGIQNGNKYYGYTLPLGSAYGGPLFFTHYSYLGMDPRNLEDQYANYWKQNKNHALIHWAYCKENPRNFVGYGENAWGLTASDNHQGYSAHSPTNDLGVITPTAAISSLPYTPEQSMDAIKHFYYKLGDRLWGPYGLYDAFNPTENWYADSYLAIDQGPIICMIENYRSALLWDLFMSAPEVRQGLNKLGFS